jgi:hypothetical protein
MMAILVVIGGVVAAAERPNVIVIFTDDNDQLSWEIGGNCCEFL